MKNQLIKVKKCRNHEIAAIGLAFAALIMEALSISFIYKIDLLNIIWMTFLIANVVFSFLYKKLRFSMRIIPMLTFSIIWIVSEILLYIKDEVIYIFSFVLFVLICVGLVSVVVSFFSISIKAHMPNDSGIFLAAVMGVFVFRYVALMMSNMWFVTDYQYNLMFTSDIIAVCCFLWGNKYLLKA